MGTCTAEARGGTRRRRAEPARVDIFFCLRGATTNEKRHQVGRAASEQIPLSISIGWKCSRPVQNIVLLCLRKSISQFRFTWPIKLLGYRFN